MGERGREGGCEGSDGEWEREGGKEGGREFMRVVMEGRREREGGREEEGRSANLLGEHSERR